MRMPGFVDYNPVEMTYKRLKHSFLLLLFFFLTISLTAQDQAAIDAGATLFKNNCGACHNRDMKSKMTGPALGGVQERWADFPQEDLYSWIRNSQVMIDAGHPMAIEMWNEWKPTVMNSFPNLTDEEITNILTYIDYVVSGAGKQGGGEAVVDECAVPTEVEEGGQLVYLFMFVVLGLLAVILARIISKLNHISLLKETGEIVPRKTLVEILTSKSIISFVIFAAIVFGGYITVNNAVQLGRQQSYQPEQPIKFSHITHTCVQKIDCNYCHDGARRSKQAVIPGASTCMNCHKAIKVGSTYGTAELTKIYASIGYDPSTDKYIGDYESLSDDEVKRIYTKWISDTYITEKGGLDNEGEALIETQWNGIAEALTNKESGDDKIQGPIEWVRIHNLPDHVYFNHSQHVTVGGIACESCHGPVQQMAQIKQYSPLSMGWCVNCHRETEVKFAGSGYYDNYYELYHQEIKDKKRDKVTVEDIGGTECQKCHY
jgi:cytochrome c2